jgi:hypothetical protein
MPQAPLLPIGAWPRANLSIEDAGQRLAPRSGPSCETSGISRHLRGIVSHFGDEVKRRKTAAVATLAMMMGCAAGRPAWAQAFFPSRPVELVVHSAPGGGSSDLIQEIAYRASMERWLPEFSSSGRAEARRSTRRLAQRDAA